MKIQVKSFTHFWNAAKSRNFILAAITVVLLCMALVLQSYAEEKQAEKQEAQKLTGKHGGRAMVAMLRPPSERELDLFADEMQLTDMQMQKIDELDLRFAKDKKTLRRSYLKAMDSVMDAIQDPAASKKLGIELANFNQIQQQILNKEIEYWNTFRAILTPEQNAAFGKIFVEKRMAANS